VHRAPGPHRTARLSPTLAEVSTAVIPALAQAAAPADGWDDTGFASLLAEASAREPTTSVAPREPAADTAAATADDARDSADDDGDLADDSAGDLAELDQLLAALAGAWPTVTTPPQPPVHTPIDAPVFSPVVLPLAVGAGGLEPDAALPGAGSAATADGVVLVDAADEPFAFTGAIEEATLIADSTAAHGGGSLALDGGDADDALPGIRSGADALPTDGAAAPFAERLLQELAGGQFTRSLETVATSAAVAAAPAPRTLAELPELLGAARDGVVRLQRDGGHWEAEIRLDPAELGAIHVRIESHGGRLQIDARCDDREVERELARLFSQWDDDLREQGGGASFAFDQAADRQQARGAAAVGAAERSVAVTASRSAGGAGSEEARQLDLLA